MRNLRLVLAYDGTDFIGWAKQPHGPGVQEALEKALKQITGKKTKVVVAGRTDTGVHANGQVVNFKTKASLNLDEFKSAINGNLPHSVRVRSISQVSDKFNARFSAKWREYLYRLALGESAPFNEHYCGTCRNSKLNLKAMRKAAAYLIGEHDFKAFSAGEDDHSMVRRLKKIEIIEKITGDYLDAEGGLKIKMIIFKLRADGFLRRMVRLIVGTLIDVGRGKITPEDVRMILELKGKKACGPAVAARGLCLVKVKY